MPTNHDHTAEAAMRLLYANATKHPSPEFVERLGRSLDLPPSHPAARSIPFRPERRSAPLIARPQQLLALLAIVVLFVSSAAWIGLNDLHAPNQSTAIQTTPGNLPGQLWSLPGGDRFSVTGYAEASNGIFYRGVLEVFVTPTPRSSTYTTTFTAFEGNTGKQLWSRELLPASAADSDALGLYLAVIDERRAASVVLLDAETGDQRWKADVPSGATHLEVVGDNVLVQDWANHLTVLDRKSGAVRWQVAIGPPSGSSEQATIPLLVYGAFVVAKAPGSPLQVLDIESGAVVWSLDVGDAIEAAISNNTLAIIRSGSNSSEPTGEAEQITAYALSTGMPLWHRELNSRISEQIPRILGTRSGFAVIARQLGEVVSDRPEGATAAPDADPEALMSTEHALGKNPLVHILFGLDPASGATSWMTEWAFRSGERDRAVSGDIAQVATIPGTDTFFITTLDLKAGWLTAPQPKFAAQMRYPDVHIPFAVVRFDGTSGRPFDIPELPFAIVLDDSNAYLAYNTAGMVALTRGDP